MNRYFAILLLVLLIPSKATFANGIQIDRKITATVFSEIINRVNPINFQAKRGQSYDESKDPALRKGTENWEQPQSSFFAIPAVVLGIIALVVFFSRK